MIGSRPEGDSAAEIRAERALSQSRRIEAADSPGKRVAVAQQELMSASRDQRRLLVDELGAVFAGSDTSWIRKTVLAADPELASAATTLQKATQSAQLATFAADQIRAGFASGHPPVTVTKLAQSVQKYDPDKEV